MFRLHIALLAGTVLLAGSAIAQQLPGNATIKGTYNFRYLGVNATNYPSDTPLSFQGTITFDGTSDASGNGGFTVTGQGAGATAATSGNIYGVQSGGTIYMANPFDPTGQAFLYGGVANGAIVLSGTDTYYCDLLIGVPVATGASNATLKGKYWLASLDFLGGNFSQTRDTFFSATSDGNGSFSTATVAGTAANLNNAPQTQATGVAYTVSGNGTGTLTFTPPGGLAAANTLLSGAKTLYVAPDGSFFIAGGSTSYDMIIGVQALTGSAVGLANGLYFNSYLENYIDPTNGVEIDAAQGSVNEVGSLGVEFDHQRIQPDSDYAADDTYALSFTPNADGTATYTLSSYVVGAGGNIILGAGNSNDYFLSFQIKAPVLTGAGVFLNPQGIVNAASFSPFTAGVSPGEFLSLFGTGLAGQTTTASSLPFPSTLGGDQVTVSWIDSTSQKTVSAQAPIYTVSPTLVSIVVPYNVPTDGSFLNFVVNNNGVPSNAGTVFSGGAQPGIFTQDLSGLGNGAIRHTTDNSVVTAANPAKVGETVAIYLTGLGPVSPAVTAGTAAPSNPLANTIIPDVFIDGVQANVLYSGLAPTLAGLYQLNVTIPSGVTAGANVTIEVDSYDSQDILLAVNAQATIPISK